jgi:hypothetical protein
MAVMNNYMGALVVWSAEYVYHDGEVLHMNLDSKQWYIKTWRRILHI